MISKHYHDIIRAKKIKNHSVQNIPTIFKGILMSGDKVPKRFTFKYDMC